jgi:hypothetical protein
VPNLDAVLQQEDVRTRELNAATEKQAKNAVIGAANAAKGRTRIRQRLEGEQHDGSDDDGSASEHSVDDVLGGSAAAAAAAAGTGAAAAAAAAAVDSDQIAAEQPDTATAALSQLRIGSAGRDHNRSSTSSSGITATVCRTSAAAAPAGSSAQEHSSEQWQRRAAAAMRQTAAAASGASTTTRVATTRVRPPLNRPLRLPPAGVQGLLGLALRVHPLEQQLQPFEHEVSTGVVQFMLT